MKETLGNVPASRLGITLTDAHRAFFTALPKVELHCHLLGAVRHETFIALAEKSNAPIDREEIDAFYTRGEKPVGVLRVLRALDEHLLTHADDLHRIAYEYLADAAAHQVRHSEFFWNPTGTVRVSKIPYADAQAAIVTAIRDAARDFGISARLIPSIDREADPDEAVALVDWMCAHRADEVAGIGIDYRENDRPPELFWKAYRNARNAGFKTTAHAGEFGMPWRNVETAVDLLQLRPDRSWLYDRRQPAVGGALRGTRHRVHRGADQLLLSAHARPGSLGRTASDAAHAGSGPENSPEYRRPDAAQSDAKRSMAIDV